jgi:iron complex outermembrane recepter protein
VYGDVTYALTSTLDLDVGLRYTRDTKEFQMFIPVPDSALGPFFVFGYSTDSPVDDEETWDDWSPRVALSWTVSNDVMLWASITKGYKAGGYGTFNLKLPSGFIPDGGPVPPGSKPQSFDPEIVWSYELGAKTNLLGGALQLNGNAYWYDYEDLQLTYFDDELLNTAVANIGEVYGMGVEVDAQAVLGEYVDLYVGLALSKTDVQEGSPLVCEVDCEGNSLPYNPEFMFATVLTVHYPFGDNEMFATGEMHHQSDTESEDINNFSIIQQPAYSVFDFRVGYREQNAKWEIAAYVENAFDEFYFDGAHSGEDPIPFATFGPARPRTFGVDLYWSM